MSAPFDDPGTSRERLGKVLEFVKTIEYSVEKGDCGADTADTLKLCAIVRALVKKQFEYADLAESRGLERLKEGA